MFISSNRSSCSDSVLGEIRKPTFSYFEHFGQYIYFLSLKIECRHLFSLCSPFSCFSLFSLLYLFSLFSPFLCCLSLSLSYSFSLFSSPFLSFFFLFRSLSLIFLSKRTFGVPLVIVQYIELDVILPKLLQKLVPVGFCVLRA